MARGRPPLAAALLEAERALADLGAMLGSGFLQHNIGARFTLDQTIAAHEAQESGTVVGNIVINMPGTA